MAESKKTGAASKEAPAAAAKEKANPTGVISCTVDEDAGTVTVVMSLLPEEKETDKMKMIASSGGFRSLGADYGGKALTGNLMVGYKK